MTGTRELTNSQCRPPVGYGLFHSPTTNSFVSYAIWGVVPIVPINSLPFKAIVWISTHRKKNHYNCWFNITFPFFVRLISSGKCTDSVPRIWACWPNTQNLGPISRTLVIQISSISFYLFLYQNHPVIILRLPWQLCSLKLCPDWFIIFSLYDPPVFTQDWNYELIGVTGPGFSNWIAPLTMSAANLKPQQSCQI